MCLNKDVSTGGSGRPDSGHVGEVGQRMWSGHCNSENGVKCFMRGSLKGCMFGALCAEGSLWNCQWDRCVELRPSVWKFGTSESIKTMKLDKRTQGVSSGPDERGAPQQGDGNQEAMEVKIQGRGVRRGERQTDSI